MKIATADQMRELDRQSIETVRIPGVILMENAGKETIDILEFVFDNLSDYHFTIIAGKGNNGGDGFVVARHLWNRQADVGVILIGTLDDLRGDARINAEIVERMGIPIMEVFDWNDDLDNILHQSDIIIDAIFGTGLSKPATGIYLSAIRAINQSESYVVSLDIPSGIFADHPDVIGESVRANLTVTFGLPKPALLLFPAAAYAGQVIVADISIPRELIDSYPIAGHILTPYDFPTLFQERMVDTHKGSYGHLLIIAGSPGKTGAAALAGIAGLRAGAGLVTVAVPDQFHSILAVKLTEVMTAPIPSGNGQYFDLTSMPTIESLLHGKSAVLIGPGLGTNPDTIAFIQTLIPQIDLPLIIDADGLNCLANTPHSWRRKKHPLIITPHPGEMSRLVRKTTAETLSQQLDIVNQYALESGAYVVFKTARTLIATPAGDWFVNITGNPGLASGGTGDVLAGLIAGYVTQGFNAQESTLGGVFLHGLAGDLAATELGEPHMIASDILAHLQHAKTSISRRTEIFDGRMIPPLDLSVLRNHHPALHDEYTLSDGGTGK